VIHRVQDKVTAKRLCNSELDLFASHFPNASTTLKTAPGLGCTYIHMPFPNGLFLLLMQKGNISSTPKKLFEWRKRGS